jgi:hypothetical protein
MISSVTASSGVASTSEISGQTSASNVSTGASFAQALAAADNSVSASAEKNSGQSANSVDGSSDQANSDSAAFEQIMAKASAQGGYNDPQAFLKTLSSSELEVLQHTHNLADPINPDGLSKEGALNLLYPLGQGKDIDHDGYVMVGLAKTWQFPPVDAPESVKQAWTKTTAGMSPNAVMALEMSFLPVYDPKTNGSTTNAYLGPDADYAALAKKALEGAQFSSKYDQAWQHETRAEEISGLESFIADLGNT